jgi:ribonuclease H / adenosylcobalamin/alpha-ribazole phosphatase
VTAWGPATEQPTVTLLLRHGQTPYSTERRFAGRADIGLTPVGAAQAEAAAARLGKLATVDAVISSPLSRARLTAGAVADACGAPVTIEERFAETDFGDWDGLTFAEAAARDPEAMEAWLASASAAPPGGESFVSVRDRVLDGLSGLLPVYQGRTVVVVSHVTPIKILLAHALEAPLTSLYRMFLDTASLSRIDWFSDGPAVVRSLNDTAHLA